jgi:hypothetical protein
MTVTVTALRAESNRLRQLGWSYRRIAGELQRRHKLGALVAFRLAHGLTQDDAARRWNERWSGDGPPKAGKNFSYWETWPSPGGRAPSPVILRRLAELYLCRPGDLLDGEDFGVRDAFYEGARYNGSVGSGGIGSGGARPGGQPVPVAQGTSPTGAPGRSERAGAAVAAAAPVAPDVVIIPWASRDGQPFVITREDVAQVCRNFAALRLTGRPVV